MTTADNHITNINNLLSQIAKVVFYFSVLGIILCGLIHVFASQLADPDDELANTFLSVVTELISVMLIYIYFYLFYGPVRSIFMHLRKNTKESSNLLQQFAFVIFVISIVSCVMFIAITWYLSVNPDFIPIARQLFLSVNTEMISATAIYILTFAFYKPVEILIQMLEDFANEYEKSTKPRYSSDDVSHILASVISDIIESEQTLYDESDFRDRLLELSYKKLLTDADMDRLKMRHWSIVNRQRNEATSTDE